MAKVNLSVSLEALMSKALRQYAQCLCDEYGVRLTAVRVDWSDAGTVAEPAYQAGKVTVEAANLPVKKGHAVRH